MEGGLELDQKAVLNVLATISFAGLYYRHRSEPGTESQSGGAQAAIERTRHPRQSSSFRISTTDRPPGLSPSPTRS